MTRAAKVLLLLSFASIIFFFLLSISTKLVLAATTQLIPASYPTSSIPVAISDGSGVTNQDVVVSINVQVRQEDGDWTLTITTTNGSTTQPRLKNALNNSTIDYQLQIHNITGTLGSGLTLSPAADTTLVFSGNSTVIRATGTPTTDTNLTFNLRMTILDASTVGKLAGGYRDTLNLALAP